MFMTLIVVVSAAWAAPARSSMGTTIAAAADYLQSGSGTLARISSAITEPVGLVLLGIGLIALSWLVRRKVSRTRH